MWNGHILLCVCVCVRGKVLLSLHIMQFNMCLLPSYKASQLTPGARVVMCHPFVCHRDTLMVTSSPSPYLYMVVSEESGSPIWLRHSSPIGIFMSFTALAVYSISPLASEWLHYRAVWYQYVILFTEAQEWLLGYLFSMQARHWPWLEVLRDLLSS